MGISTLHVKSEHFVNASKCQDSFLLLNRSLQLVLALFIGRSKGECRRHAPPNGIQFFYFCTHFHRKVPTSEVGAPQWLGAPPQREILDPSLLLVIIMNNISTIERCLSRKGLSWFMDPYNIYQSFIDNFLWLQLWCIKISCSVSHCMLAAHIADENFWLIWHKCRGAYTTVLCPSCIVVVAVCVELFYHMARHRNYVWREYVHIP